MKKSTQQLLDTIDTEKFKNLYCIKNNEELSKIFNISQNQVKLIANYLQIKRSKEQIKKIKNQTLIEKYGSLENYYNLRTQKTKQTNLIKYGNENYNNIKLCVKNRFNKFDTREDYNKHFKQAYEQTLIEKYGSLENYYSLHSQHVSETVKQRDPAIHKLIYKKVSNSWKTKTQKELTEIIDKRKQSLIQHYGSLNNYKEQMLNKVTETVQNKYNVAWSCMRQEAQKYSGNNSKINKHFEDLLLKNNIIYTREFIIDKYSYDFKIDNILIEINPTITHNTAFSPYGKHVGIDKEYHIQKTVYANQNEYRCIHVWDWDDINKILNLIIAKQTIYARDCLIKEVSIKECNNFLKMYHLQESCKGQSIRLGLYYNNELIQVMTFGKPRYNKKYEWELIRLCTHSQYQIIGGSEKLFKYFIKHYNPKSIISYCDNSKFIGNVYINLGFTKLQLCKPSIHWYNPKTKKHITDNLLRQRGFDQLFGTNYGKGTSNEELMLNNGFYPIYDCGQSVYIFTNN